MRRKDTISYLGVWENLHNLNFKSIEFDAIKNASGTNRFILTAARRASPETQPNSYPTNDCVGECGKQAYIESII